MRSPVTRGFTLIEILISIAILSILISLLLPALGRGMARARAFRCQMNVRSIAFSFSLFADADLSGLRTKDEDRAGAGRFSLESFIESEYRIDEFWPPAERRAVVTRTADASDDPTRCPDVKGDITVRRNLPCQRINAIAPPQNISMGFNARLFRVESMDVRGRVRLNEVFLRPEILGQGRVPLVWEIDGGIPGARNVVPHFTAPSLSPSGPYARSQYWWPAFRHARTGHYGLIDGSVHATASPLTQTWNWSYQPRP
ncbi:MAG: prepilin-type N-terminal cleavage/methylation domain-containing protein [Planctomycetota bacterium]|nr:prepilin-type N-terminal cleavage/methylation domain-containing protein [Planctomycetota bacterium]